MMVDGTEERWRLEWNLMVDGTGSVKGGLQTVEDNFRHGVYSCRSRICWT
jgi:hypothetical protein